MQPWGTWLRVRHWLRQQVGVWAELWKSNSWMYVTRTPSKPVWTACLSAGWTFLVSKKNIYAISFSRWMLLLQLCIVFQYIPTVHFFCAWLLLIVSNAGMGLIGPIECQSIDEMRTVMDTNFFGLVRLLKEVLPDMKRRKKGHIVVISSVMGIQGEDC